MDAVEFLKSYKRMCESDSRFMQINLYRTDFESMVSYAEQWAKEHPAKTRQSEFLKMFPNAFVDDDGVLSIPPCNVDRAVSGACAKKTCWAIDADPKKPGKVKIIDQEHAAELLEWAWCQYVGKQTCFDLAAFGGAKTE